MEVKIRNNSHSEKSNPTTPETENIEFQTKALVACGGDFTIYIDEDGRIYATGNSHLQVPFLYDFLNVKYS
jgi:alpha-tubulin suppressor-like RCC1 family protein